MAYTEWLQQYFAANDVDSANKQCAILLSSCGADTYQVIRNLVAPLKPSDKSFKQIVDLVREHYCPQPSAIVQHFAFNNRVQQAGESTGDFVAELRRLSEHCQFAGSLDDMLRDRLVCGVRDGRLQRRLLAEPDLTFRKAFELCQASELAEKNAQELQAGQKQNQKVAGASVLALYPSSSGGKQQTPGHQPACYWCNGTQHLAKDCRFRSAACHACGKKGHIAKACRSKGKSQNQQYGKSTHSRRSSQHTHQLTAEDSQTDDGSYSLFRLSAP